MTIRRKRRIVTDLNSPAESAGGHSLTYGWETVIVDQLNPGDYIRTLSCSGTIKGIERVGITKLWLDTGHPGDYLLREMHGVAKVQRRIELQSRAVAKILDTLCESELSASDNQNCGSSPCNHTHSEFLYSMHDEYNKYLCNSCGSTFAAHEDNEDVSD